MAYPKTITRKAAALIFVFLLFFSTSAFSQSCPAQGTQIFPELTGQELLDALVQEYKSTTVLGYDSAREEMYGNIDNVDGFVEGIYTGYQGEIDPNGGNVRSQANDVSINAEHSWPQSKGASSGNANSDMHHLYPAYASANSSRGNHPFYEIPDTETDSWWRLDQSSSTADGSIIDEYSERDNSHPNQNYSARWEPRESVEGDIARSMFYFYTMYKTEADNADPIFFEIQKDFLRSWNTLDSVSTKEYNRTCAIAPFQGDKVNPFVIDPTLVERAFFEGEISQTNVEFSASVLTISEGQDMLQVEVSITNPNPDTATTIDVVYTGGTATSGDDFQNINTQTLTFPAGSLDRQSIVVSIIDDEAEESEETILLGLENIDGPQNAVIGEVASTEITIRDNDGVIPSTAWTNELHYDNDGTDEGEFIEIAVNAEFADLSTVNLNLYNGSNGSVYATYSGTDFVKGSTENGISFYYVDLPTNGLQNGAPDGFSLDIGGELIQFLSYEGTFTAVDGPAQDIESTDIGVEESNSTPLENSLSLAGSGSGYADFNWENTPTNTKGEVNTNQTIQTPTSNEDENPTIAGDFKLHQNYPNPFNPTTNISYELKNAVDVTLSVYNVLGQKVVTLVDGMKNAGSHSATFDASGLSSGVYFYQLRAGEVTFTQKMLLSK
jgi:endonuclease I